MYDQDQEQVVRVPAGKRRLSRVALRVRSIGWPGASLVVLLALTAVLYLWALDRSGWANTYYAAAVQAATKSWKAFFFGSFDSSNFITVDKAPGFLWPMVVSARIFGLGIWSILVPEALAGVATVGVSYAAVKRWWGPAAGLIAGAVVAATPVAALMFRYNNPEALFTLVLALGAYAVMRAIESGRTWWLILAGVLVGFAFLTKMLEAFLVIPPFALAYLVAGKPRLLKRIWQVGATAVAVAASAGWWVVVVQLWPAASRPFISGSTNNSVIELALGYNGLGRIGGTEVGAVGPQGPVTGPWINAQIFGKTGIFRLFRGNMSTEISWLLPAAVLALLVGLALAIVYRKESATGRIFRGGLLAWGGWLASVGLTFSYMRGIIHPYYNIALAPPIGVLLGMVVPQLWKKRKNLLWRAVISFMIGATAAWGWWVLARQAPGWRYDLRWGLALAGVSAGALFFFLGAPGHRLWRRAVTGVLVTASIVGALGFSTAWTFATVGQPHIGAIPSSGPSAYARVVHPTTVAGSDGGTSTQGQAAPPPTAVNVVNNVNKQLVAVLQQDASSYRWTAAMTSASTAAPLQLASGTPIMAIGGFNGTDVSMTLVDFQALVAAHKIHYYIAGGGYAGSPNTGVEAYIANWAQTSFPVVFVGRMFLYDLTAPLQPLGASASG
jgi:4-amino-4-deoxy-L-arabinose transferase-like glycosyltransferase